MTPPPEAIELAIELINSVAGVAHTLAASSSTTLEAICVDQLGRIEIALEIETRFDHVIPDGEVHEWKCIGDIASSIAPLLHRSAV